MGSGSAAAAGSEAQAAGGLVESEEADSGVEVMAAGWAVEVSVMGDWAGAGLVLVHRCRWPQIRFHSSWRRRCTNWPPKHPG